MNENETEAATRAGMAARFTRARTSTDAGSLRPPEFPAPPAFHQEAVDPLPPVGTPGFWNILGEKLALEVLSVKTWVFLINVLGDVLTVIASNANLHALISVAIINVLSGIFIIGRAIVDASGNGTTAQAIQRAKAKL